MKIKFLLSTFIIAVISFTACKKKDFGDTNLNPAPDVSVTPAASDLLTNAMWRSVSSLTYGLNDILPTLYVQYLSEAQYQGNSLYVNPTYDWASYYVVPLQDLQKIIGMNSGGTGEAANQLAVAKIMKAYLFMQVTDRWGDIPFSTALDGNRTPTYDKQSDVYAGLETLLKEANTNFSTSVTTIKGDVIYNGDISKWKKFANSLRMIIAMRASKADNAFAKAQFLDAYNDAAGHITTNADNAAFQYIASFGSPLFSNFQTRTDYGVAQPFLDAVNSLYPNNADPRLPRMLTKSSATGDYKPIPYGLSANNMALWLASNASTPGSYSIVDTAVTFNNISKGIMVSAAEVLLVRAEAAAYGWIPTNNCQDYYNAIAQSMDQWGVTNPTDITNYSTSIGVSIGTSYSTAALNKIYLQKYITLFMNGGEAWSEVRRTGVPALTPAPDARNVSKLIPRRILYPSTELSLNNTNYLNAVKGITGGDSPDSRVWWDKP